jgi:mitochondrial fission protein ELM1
MGTDLKLRSVPEKLVFGPKPGAGRAALPPVRMFLGTEDSQYRAERVFLYSVEKHRNPSRTYEIYLMKNIAGFTRGSWRTNFTNYRFAIPDWAGKTGKAIYNDVDQIYLVDPAELFDLDLGTHGYLSVSAEDTSVMLLDCARMAAVWNLAAASTQDKSELLKAASSQDGLWGPLDGGWNARDLEYRPESSKAVHFTLLHTQPWMPSPDQYSYHPHPFGDLWHSLEREADKKRFHAFNVAQPSARYSDAIAKAEAGAAARAGTGTAQDLAALVAHYRSRSVLGCTSSKATPVVATDATVTRFVPAAGASWPEGSFDAVLVNDLLEHLPAEDVAWVLDEIFRRAERLVSISVLASDAPVISVPDSNDPCLCLRPVEWWRQQVQAAARGRVAWRLDARSATEPTRRLGTFEALSESSRGAPTVWLLLGVKGGDNAQVVDLANALGWPYEAKQLAFNPLHVVPSVLVRGSLANLDRRGCATLAPPWPDLVISSGKRSVPVAKWIQEQSEGRARLIHVGRPWAPLEWFDLIITTPQYGLPARPNVLHNTLPLHGVAGVDRKDGVGNERWERELKGLAKPLVAVLVGGNSPSYVIDPATAAKLGAEASVAARKLGGSLLVVTSPRTSPEAADALEAAVEGSHFFHRWRKGSDNPYRAILALADRFVVTGDSASMIAEACATGRSVSIYPVPRRFDAVPGSAMFRDGIVNWRASRTSYRGTPKQQDWVSRFYDRLVDAGLLTPPRDLEAYHERLCADGLVTLGISTNGGPHRRRAFDDIERAVERVRQVWNAARSVR